MIPIQLTNTLSRTKEVFKPLHEGEVSIYHCGPTVYWNQHIGNLRAMVIADIVRRTFEYNDYKVTFVRNYTDVGHLTGDNIGDADAGEDRMAKAAKRENSTPDQIADRYIKIFNEDLEKLNVKTPEERPRATQYIQDMIEMVQTLLNKGFAYPTPYAIYFDVTKFPEYTKLSGQKLELLETGEGHGNVGDANKKNTQDFAVWFFKAGAHEKALQTWSSPFPSPLVSNGEGFPGWHIECSAMSKHFLGDTLDIHMGGIEHVSIHHTNEIAQSECANGTPFVHYWLHNEHLLVDGKKMSKSEGTSYLLQDIIDKGISPLALRYFFLQAHYRSKQNFTWDALKASTVNLVNIQALFNNYCIEKMGTKDYRGYTPGIINLDYKKEFIECINNDFNTPQALAVLWKLFKALKDKKIAEIDCIETVLDFDKVLDLGLRAYFKKIDDEAIERNKAMQDIVLDEKIEDLKQKRQLARNSKNWTESDRIRDVILNLGYTIKDEADGSQTLVKR